MLISAYNFHYLSIFIVRHTNEIALEIRHASSTPAPRENSTTRLLHHRFEGQSLTNQFMMPEEIMILKRVISWLPIAISAYSIYTQGHWFHLEPARASYVAFSRIYFADVSSVTSNARRNKEFMKFQLRLALMLAFE